MIRLGDRTAKKNFTQGKLIKKPNPLKRMKPGTVPPLVAVVLAMCAVAFITSVISELPILDGIEVYAMIIVGMAVFYGVLRLLGHRAW